MLVVQQIAENEDMGHCRYHRPRVALCPNLSLTAPITPTCLSYPDNALGMEARPRSHLPSKTARDKSRRHSSRRTRIRLLTCATFRRRSLGLIRRRAKWTDLVRVDADGFVVLAEDDARDVVGYVLGADVGVQRDVRGALEVVRVLVEAHRCFVLRLVCWVRGVDAYTRTCGEEVVMQD